MESSLTTTYNHYDGYPESLGVGLNNKFYDKAEEAKEIANMRICFIFRP